MCGKYAFEKSLELIDHLDVLPKVVKELGITPKGSNRVLTVANGCRAGVLGKLNDVPIELGGAAVKTELVVLYDLPFNVVIGLPTIARQGGNLEVQKS